MALPGWVRAVHNESFGPYYTSTSYLSEAAELVASGKPIGAIAAVLMATPSRHGLNWPALGFSS